MNKTELKKNIYWVGAIDWDLRNFHGYLTQLGTSYNAFLIIDEQVTLIDTVKADLCDQMIARISKIIDPSKIDNIVINHVEMDHSGSLPHIAKIAPNAKVITSPQGKKGLSSHYRGTPFNFEVVKTGDRINIGSHNIDFTLTPMVHWPDNMVCFCPEARILFSNDAFGQHIASTERFDDEYPKDIILHEAKKYYANIVLPYSAQVKKAIEAVSTLDINMIAPSHGLIWRRDLKNIISSYQKWCTNDTEDKGIIIYDTMWGSTKKIALTLQEAFEENNIKIKMINLRKNHISDIMTHVLPSKYICIGSPTLNNNMLPTVAGFLTYLKGLAPKNRVGLAFGSYGWGGQGVTHISEAMKSCGFSMLENIKFNYIPEEKELSLLLNSFKERLITPS